MNYIKARAHHKLLQTPYNQDGLSRIAEACKVAFRPYANPHEGDTYLSDNGKSYDVDLCWPIGKCKECDEEYAARYKSCAVGAADLDKEMIPRLLATVEELQSILKAHRGSDK